MHQLFIAHAEEDAGIVWEIARNLECEGYRCWFYERDTVAGRSYLQQVHEGVSAADVLLLLVSRHSLESQEVTREVELAHRKGRLFLPLMLDVDDQDLDRRRPDWSTALGATVYLRVGGLATSVVVQSILKSLETLDVKPGAKRMPSGIGNVPVTAPIPRPGVTPWASDGNQIDIPQLDDVVFQTPFIKEFLDSDQKFFVAANKGLGKTLLLRYKRSLLMNRCQSEHERSAGGHPSVHFVPENRPYLDLMSDLPSMSKSHGRFLSTLRDCKRLWSFALRASAASHFPALVARDPGNGFASLPPRLARWLDGRRVEPTVVFKELLSFSVRELNQILDGFENSLDYLFRNIHSGVFIFVDKVDQGIRSLPRDAWTNVQASLIEAAWDVMSANNHIKVYASLREEAYASYVSEVKPNLFGAVTTLQYSSEDLRQLIDKLTQFYEGVPTFPEFVRLNAVRNTQNELAEDSFRYLHRHTIGRPRDLVIVCSEIARRRAQLTETTFRRVVNESAANSVVKNVFDEMQVFLDCLRDGSDRQEFFAMLPFNILTRPELIRICCEFNGVDPANYGDIHSTGDVVKHPFCELYACGLLGIVRDDLIGGKSIQQFKQPHDVTDDVTACLPAADYYLLHPSLQSRIHQQRGGMGYRVFKYVLVGHGYPWQDHYRAMINVQRHLIAVRESHVLEAVEATLAAAHARICEGLAGGFQPSAWQAPPDVRPELERLGYDDLWLAVDHLAEHGQKSIAAQPGTRVPGARKKASSTRTKRTKPVDGKQSAN